MEKKDLLTITLIALIASLGVQTTDTVLTDELEHHYSCIVDDKIIGDPVEFKGGISKSTGYSGYPFEGTTKGRVYCNSNDIKGKWIQVGVLATRLGIDPYDLIVKEEEDKPTQPKQRSTGSGARQEECKIDGKCYPL